MQKVILNIGLIFFTLVAMTPAMSCLLTGATQLPANTSLALSQTVYDFVIADPAIGTAILDSRDEWDQTAAINRIGDWNGIINLSDCPDNQSMQIGIMPFTSPCARIQNDPNITNLTGAFVDYGVTNSITLNLNYAWSLNPGPGELDIQAYLVHEFGHVLGVGHADNGICGNFNSPTCAIDNNQDTMGKQIVEGNTCERSINANDIHSISELY